MLVKLLPIWTDLEKCTAKKYTCVSPHQNCPYNTVANLEDSAAIVKNR